MLFRSIGNLFLPPNRQKTARPISQAFAPQWRWSATVCITVRERGTTVEIAPKLPNYVDRYHVPLPSICHQLLLHTFNAIFIKRFGIFLLCWVDCRVWRNRPVLFVRIYRTNVSSKNLQNRGNCILIDRSTKRKLYLSTMKDI